MFQLSTAACQTTPNLVASNNNLQRSLTVLLVAWIWPSSFCLLPLMNCSQIFAGAKVTWRFNWTRYPRWGTCMAGSWCYLGAQLSFCWLKDLTRTFHVAGNRNIQQQHSNRAGFQGAFLEPALTKLLAPLSWQSQIIISADSVGQVCHWSQTRFKGKMELGFSSSCEEQNAGRERGVWGAATFGDSQTHSIWHIHTWHIIDLDEHLFSPSHVYCVSLFFQNPFDTYF